MPAMRRWPGWIDIAAMVAVVLLVMLVAYLPGVGETFRGVILGAVIAGAVSVGGEIIRGRQEATLDKTKRADNRGLWTEGFQRDTMIDLGQRLNEWMDVRARLAAGWGAQRIAGKPASLPEVEREGFATARRLDFLIERVLDDPLRKHIEAVRALAGIRDGGMAHSPSKVSIETLERDWNELSALAHTAQLALGVELRKVL